MAERQWFYEMLTEEFGPVTAAELEEMIANGMLSATDRVRSGASGEWITVADFPAAVVALSQGQPDERHSDLDIDSFSFESTSDAEPDALDIDSFNLHGDSDSPQPVTANRHQPSEPVEDEDDFEPTFFVQSLGQVLGPLTQDELVEMACAGSLSRGDEIRGGEDSRWIAVEAIPGLSEEILRQEATLTQAPATGASTEAEPIEKEKEKPRQRSAIKATAKAKADAKTGAKAKPKGRKRKRRPKTDEFLQEIFAEVFTEDGKVREDRMAAAPPAAMAPPVNSLGDNGGMGMGMAAASATSSTGPAMPAAPSSPPAFTRPIPKPAAKKASKSSGGGFEMPEPKVLGIIGGGLALVLILVGGFMGIIPLPGFGVDPESFFKEFAAEYPKMKDGSAEDWKQFKTEKSAVARGIARDLAPSVGTDPKAKRFQRAALLVTKIVTIDQADKEKHTEAYAEFNKMLVGG